MTATSSLTDRYVAATLRSLPDRQRQDIEAELRALVADARREAGVDADSAERQVLTELGAPARLAASYSDRSLNLIGPEFYLDYVRVLTVLLSTLVPLWFVIFALVTFADGWSEGANVIAGVVIVVLILLSVSDAVGGFVRASKKRRTR